MGKRKTSESGGNSTKKPTAGREVPPAAGDGEAEELLPAKGAPPDVVESEHAAQPRSEEESPNLEVEPQDQDEISKLKKQIADNEKEIANLNKRIDEHDKLKEILVLWHTDPQQRNRWLSESKDFFVRTIVKRFPSLEEQEAKLEDHALSQESYVQDLHRRAFKLYDENKDLQSQLTEISRGSHLPFPSPETKERTNGNSGIVYMEDKCGIEIDVVPSRKIGLGTNRLASPTTSEKGNRADNEENEREGRHEQKLKKQKPYRLPIEGDGSRPVQCAKEAAQYGRRFQDLENAVYKFHFFIDGGIGAYIPTISPFYFQGRAKSRSPTMEVISTEVFLKVWKAVEVDRESVVSEWRNHHWAFKAGVPVAAPVLSELARSTCSCGLEYLVSAVEFIPRDEIETVMDLWYFCSQLIEAVSTLHQKARLLHCDLKADNVHWTGSRVYLVDFGHCQDLDDFDPQWSPGTDGYQAPEILHYMPCSTETDTFSVGKIMNAMIEDFVDDHARCSDDQSSLTQSPIAGPSDESVSVSSSEQKAREKKQLDLLSELSVQLTHPDPCCRWTLDQALEAMWPC